MTFPESLGPFSLHPPRSDDPEPTWGISLDQVWIPGRYASRDAALIASGILLADEQRGRLLLLALRDAHPGRAITVEQLADADSILESTDIAGKIREELAEHARFKAARIAGKPGDPPDPKFPPTVETRLGIAEGWYQAADWLWPRETT